ncbi:DUF6600 domain-containing protein [Devosia sp. A449]
MPLGVTTAQAQAQSVSVSFQLFFDQLEPHGVWVRHARYNYVFCPTGVDTTWRPYSHGRWLYVENRGWYFASDEPFAWATYHYGRWFADQELGWCWVPGTKWAPAWVSWRRSDTIVGWAPLPPEGDGFAVSLEISRLELPEGYWVYVPTKQFVVPDLAINIVLGSQQPDYYAQTQFLGPVVVEGDLVINNVIDITYIEQTINQEVIIYQPQEAEDPAAQSVDIDAQAIAIFDQDITEPTEEAAPPEAVEGADAAATIETEGGTAGATADLPEETGAGTEAAVAPAKDEPASPDAAPESGAEQPAADQPAANPAAPAEPAAEGEVAPAEPSAQPDSAAPADQPAATDETTPAAGDELLCPPETMVDGKCPPLPGEDQQPAAADPAAPTDVAPAPDAAPADAAPAEAAPEAAPAPEPEAAPADAPADAEAVEPGEATTPKKPLCPVELMVDGKCPLLPGQPAQPAQ